MVRQFSRKQTTGKYRYFEMSSNQDINLRDESQKLLKNMDSECAPNLSEKKGKTVNLQVKWKYSVVKLYDVPIEISNKELFHRLYDRFLNCTVRLQVEKNDVMKGDEKFTLKNWHENHGMLRMKTIGAIMEVEGRNSKALYEEVESLKKELKRSEDERRRVGGLVESYKKREEILQEMIKKNVNGTNEWKKMQDNLGNSAAHDFFFGIGTPNNDDPADFGSPSRLPNKETKSQSDSTAIQDQNSDSNKPNIKPDLRSGYYGGIANPWCKGIHDGTPPPPGSREHNIPGGYSEPMRMDGNKNRNSWEHFKKTDENYSMWGGNAQYNSKMDDEYE